MSNVKVLDLGGSIVAPDEIDVSFIRKFRIFLESWLLEDTNNKAIIVIGGGSPARKYQQAYREIVSESDHSEQDWIGITATRLNAQLIKAVFNDYCREEVVIDPTAPESFEGQVMIAAGWKPGFSTDFDSVVLAQRFGADTILNLSNIAKVYTADPKKDPHAKPLDYISWEDYKKMAGDEWIPGFNVPFDPVATKKAAELNMKVIAADGKDLENLQKIFDGEEFVGTVIGRQ
ncbi:MAG: UMP kinase [Spirochaetaceae bacterium]|nr:UMP kinase [Spirochaetaceae bacterium]